MTKQIKSKGFTIVELLIVIVVIAILAAITIVAYNGIQQRAHTTSAKTAAENLAKKVEAYNAIKNVYPTYSTTGSAVTTSLNSVTDSSLTGSGITLSTAALTSAPANDNTVNLQLCIASGTLTSGTTVPTGYVVYIWDSTASPAAAVAVQAGGTSTTGTPGTCGTVS